MEDDTDDKLLEEKLAKGKYVSDLKCTIIADLHDVKADSIKRYLSKHPTDSIIVYNGNPNGVMSFYFDGKDARLQAFDAYKVKGELGRKIRKALGIKDAGLGYIS